jgi:hypothetical protein
MKFDWDMFAILFFGGLAIGVSLLLLTDMILLLGL